jgi:hypothetical protein
VFLDGQSGVCRIEDWPQSQRISQALKHSTTKILAQALGRICFVLCEHYNGK